MKVNKNRAMGLRMLGEAHEKRYREEVEAMDPKTELLAKQLQSWALGWVDENDIGPLYISLAVALRANKQLSLGLIGNGGLN